MPVQSTHPPLSQALPPLILGGAGFSNQLNANPTSLPVRQVIKEAFNLGIRAIDTSPYYYGPSEQLIGDALSQPEIVKHYPRKDYILMTKVGRISAAEFNYSPSCIRTSILRSLERLDTSYLDVIFCHDAEYITDGETLIAIGVLLDFVRDGKIRYVGISGYRIDILMRLAKAARQRYSRPLGVVQNWAQLTLQNSRLETQGLDSLRNEGVSCVCSSSPLAIGLLRSGGVPQGSLGDFHPAPAGLRAVAKEAAEFVVAQTGESMASLALQYALSRAPLASMESFRVSTITGISSVSELKEKVMAARQILKGPVDGRKGSILDYSPQKEMQFERDKSLYKSVRRILGPWVGYCFPSPGEGWCTERKRMLGQKKSANL
ncbi:hypothetical protein MPDQ_006279 [Monascus purpureus]|uniref:NADP-dependent oxidoreductase domain-containing protein n=1 Tax=Monascus purpureus TaxID=5098 RepID=A0A507QWX4_MONPU|nr:hypothetical protein MPDQ_006279 [Monascus purpureus]BDD63935.1 hypothetical protein MAP00_008790 [Monascus purpureus]